MKNTFERIDTRFEKERSLFMRDQYIKILRQLNHRLEWEARQRGE